MPLFLLMKANSDMFKKNGLSGYSWALYAGSPNHLPEGTADSSTREGT